MIQDTRYKRRLDDLPNLRIHGYHTYHRTMDKGGHGMVTMIKYTIPSEGTEQRHLGHGTETISTRIWLNNKPPLLHNIYRVDGELDITTPLTREPRSITLETRYDAETTIEQDAYSMNNFKILATSA